MQITNLQQHKERKQIKDIVQNATHQELQFKVIELAQMISTKDKVINDLLEHIKKTSGEIEANNILLTNLIDSVVGDLKEEQ